MAAVIRKNREEVLLDYGDPSDLGRHHSELKHQPDDRKRMALIAAEREILTLRIIAEHAEFSDIAMTRIVDALTTIQRALKLMRPSLGLHVYKAWT
jgi:hypothetical protein